MFKHLYDKDYKDTRYLPNIQVTEEQYRIIDESVHIDAREQYVARNVMPFKNVGGGLGTQSWGYDTLTEMSEAIIRYQLEQYEDNIDLTRTNVPVPIVQKKFRIGARDIESSATGGPSLNTNTVESAVYRVEDKLDELILQGWTKNGTNYEASGLYQSAGNTTAGGTWGTGTNIPTNILAAMTLLKADNIMPPYNLVVNSAQYNELLALIASTGITYLAHVKNIIGGEIFESQTMTDGQGMLIKGGPHKFFEFILAADRIHREWRDDDTEDLIGRVYVVGVPIIYDTNAICTITGI